MVQSPVEGAPDVPHGQRPVRSKLAFWERLKRDYRGGDVRARHLSRASVSQLLWAFPIPVRCIQSFHNDGDSNFSGGELEHQIEERLSNSLLRFGGRGTLLLALPVEFCVVSTRVRYDYAWRYKSMQTKE
jgi:hypothetical protein